MTCTGLNKYLTERSEEKQENRDDASGARAGKLAAKARPKPTSLPMSSSLRFKIPFNMREWIDVEPGEYDHHSFDVAKKTNRFLRHDLLDLREEDGAVEFKVLAPMFISRFESSPHWSIRTRLKYLQRGGGPKKRFQYCLDPCSDDTFLLAIQGHSEGNQIDPALQGNVLLPSDFAEYIYHVGSSHDMHSIIQSGLIPGGKDVKRGRQTVFFTAVNPMFAHLHKPRD